MTAILDVRLQENDEETILMTI